jgi:hypothetical protein
MGCTDRVNFQPVIVADKGGNMTRGNRYLASFLLSSLLAVPIAIHAGTRPQEGERQEERSERHERNERRNRRVYDREHKDYHNWDDSEDRNYRRYLDEQHRDYRDFSRENRRRQNEYWKWRHEHTDDDGRR